MHVSNAGRRAISLIRVTRTTGRPIRRQNNTHRRRPFQTIAGECGSARQTSRLAPGSRAAIEGCATAIPREFGDESGVLYSGRIAFPEPGRHCMLGNNPGGDPAIQERGTVEWRARKALVASRRQVRSSTSGPRPVSASRHRSWFPAIATLCRCGRLRKNSPNDLASAASPSPQKSPAWTRQMP